MHDWDGSFTICNICTDGTGKFHKTKHIIHKRDRKISQYKCNNFKWPLQCRGPPHLSTAVTAELCHRNLGPTLMTRHIHNPECQDCAVRNTILRTRNAQSKSESGIQELRNITQSVAAKPQPKSHHRDARQA